ncbi:TM0106 family RecB-like putative nuclease [Microbacterium sp. STN6]|uniref:TM0106 family RecB-like putative nuclease n=1 Tax=Microbacterium sp. STN6 TaxID=2995588 RepID=UPI0022609807|nr:bifunctional RecB family nuclease/DEAD/DEAH box helicase [Microbacterium sp. STN6]MCX7521766.1 TM0106 family RecB-like putative nuclease [Microbacterium sp. STN6]
MFMVGGTAVTSASDLAAASACEFAFLRGIDVKLGRIEALPDEVDEMYERTSRLGDEHEHRVLEQYRERFGAGVAEIARPASMQRADIEAAVDETVRAFGSDADVVFQATFFDGSFIGFADFIVRRPDGSWLVQDTKLARHARVTALMQLAAYSDQLRRIGLRPAETVQLLLGDGTVSEHALRDIVPVFRKRRARLQQIIDERMLAHTLVAWGDERYSLCGHCPACEAEIQASDDVLLVAGMRVTQRARLGEAGIRTVQQLALSDGPVDGIAESTLAGMRMQATLQLTAAAGAPPPVELYNPPALAALPEPNPGDIFFDFEGDPLYTEGAGNRWGLDYLFGLVETDETFRAFWAHGFAEERQALLDFLAYLTERRRRYPGMHVYHYASYERTHLLSLAARHGVGEDAVDQLLRENVLVDLYPLVRRALRVGSRSYSIKKLEPLYMGDELRSGEVQTAAASITEYANAVELRATGDVVGSDHMLAIIADYNRYDCVSTARLRDWLLAHARGSGVRIGASHAEEDETGQPEPSPLTAALLARAGDPLHERDADQTAAALAAAAIDYHRREQKSFWWGHYARLEQPVQEWEDTRDVLIVEHARVERDWHIEGRQRTQRRWLRLSGRLAPGSRIAESERSGPFLLYEYPAPFPTPRLAPGSRGARTARVLEVRDDGSVLVEETLHADAAAYTATPSALAPASPPAAGSQTGAIEEWAERIVEAAPGWPADAMTDVLRRVPPRTRSGRLAPVDDALLGEDRVTAVVASLLDLDDSYLAVQGPPGTGKTYLGAHVIAELVSKHHWKIGVVAQSHPVVENLLAAVVRAGLDAGLVGKVPKAGGGAADPSESAYEVLPKDGQLAFGAEHAASGYVIGGTAWDFSNKARVLRRSLDLLVVDEAGQFSLASTIAASVGARNLLLLGDPQQLPQVSQGTHPEPIDRSALGWVSDGHDVLPAELGYFLAESRRMHPAVTAPVSRLSYEGMLRSHPVASTRHLDGVRPGLHVVGVEHTGDSVESAEEVVVVVDLARSVLGRMWRDPTESAEPRPLEAGDVIVVTPYNAQQNRVRDALIAAGLGGIRVGTVDRFQGQEAAVAIVSLAASSAEDVPRGMSFLIMKNRLNVAISRAKWVAYLVYSPALTEYLPSTPPQLAELSAFIELTQSGDAIGDGAMGVGRGRPSDVT